MNWVGDESLTIAKLKLSNNICNFHITDILVSFKATRCTAMSLSSALVIVVLLPVFGCVQLFLITIIIIINNELYLF